MQALLLTLLAGAAAAGDDAAWLDTRIAGAETIASAAEQLAQSSADLAGAAARMETQKSCAMDRELIGLGSALRHASDALLRLGPLVIHPASRDVYRDALGRIADASKRLLALDPIGAAGPPAGVGSAIREAGQAVMKLKEQPADGIHLRTAGDALEALRLANGKLDKDGCVRNARLLAHATGLMGAGMSFASGTLRQGPAAHLLAASLLEMSVQTPMPKPASLPHALALYAGTLLQQGKALRRQSEIAAAMSLPEYHAKAPEVAKAAARFEALAARVEEARKQLAAGTAAALRQTGSTLENHGVMPALIATGDALRRAGELVEKGERPAAAKVLADAAQKILAGEKLLQLEEP